MTRWRLGDVMRSRAAILVLLLGLAHGVMDGAAGYLMGGQAGKLGLAWVVGLVLLYDVLAFAAQPLVGAAVDRRCRPRSALLLAFALMAAALALRAVPLAAVTLAGAASALFHVAGGAVVLSVRPRRADGAGVFTAPGVVGLALGGVLAAGGYPATWLFLGALVGLALGLAVLRPPDAPPAGTRAVAAVEAHDVVMIVLLAAVAVRSAAWTAWDLAVQGQTTLLFAAALAASCGKLGGGLLADRIGWRRWAVAALTVSAPLLALGPGQPAAFLLGIGLLQSVTPVVLAVAARLLPGRPATASGLVLGLAVAAGGLAVLLGLGPPLTGPPGAIGASLAAALALWWVVGRASSAPGRRLNRGVQPVAGRALRGVRTATGGAGAGDGRRAGGV